MLFQDLREHAALKELAERDGQTAEMLGSRFCSPITQPRIRILISSPRTKLCLCVAKLLS